MNSFRTFDTDTILSRIPLGFNNQFDADSLGMAPGEYVMLGGWRGSAKSVLCSNVVCNQYKQGNSSLYFTIEMSDREVYDRNIAILSDVEIKRIKRGNLTEVEKMAIAKVRAGMTTDGSLDLLERYQKDADFEDFETKLLDRPLKRDNKIITIDNSNLTMTNIDATIHKYKTKLGDKLKVVVVDYINQISCSDQFDWKVQIELSKKLKALAKKYEVVLFTPYQISEEGKTRFSKGILDSPDWAFHLTPVKFEGSEVGAIEFECKKSRGDDDRFDFASEINWNTLRVFPDRNLELTKNQLKKAKESKTTEAANDKDDLKI